MNCNFCNSLIQRAASSSPAYLTAKEGCKHKICKTCIANILRETAVGLFMICPVENCQGKFDVKDVRYDTGFQSLSGDSLFESIKRQSSELAAKRKREAHNRRMKRYKQKQENKASIAESNRRYHENNKESNKARFKQHYENNKEAIKEKAQQHYEDNKESIRDAQQQYYKTSLKKKPSSSNPNTAQILRSNDHQQTRTNQSNESNFAWHANSLPGFYMMDEHPTPEQISGALSQHLTPAGKKSVQKKIINVMKFNLGTSVGWNGEISEQAMNNTFGIFK